ncbi:MAG: signal peptidase II [Gammaproteobacteria bacterium]
MPNFPRSKFYSFYPWLILVLLFLSDRGTKIWAESVFKEHDILPIFPGFKLTLEYNVGAAFSILNTGAAWQKLFLLSMSFLASVFLGAWLWFRPPVQFWQRISLALILSGALGNLWDRFFYGKVTDFILLYYQDYYWPAFNIADSAISIGAGLMALWIWQDSFSSSKPAK